MKFSNKGKQDLPYVVNSQLTIIGIEVDFMDGYANSPRIILKTKGSADDVRMHYQEHEIGNAQLLYTAELNGLYKFMVEDFRNRDGYGGAVFTLNMVDGTTRDVQGPWSSNTTTANCHLTHPCKEVTFDDGRYHTSGAFSTALLKRWLEDSDIEARLLGQDVIDFRTIVEVVENM